MSSYAKVIVLGSPITKSNFKLHNSQGRAILPSNSGKYHDKFALYEQEIAYVARSQNPDIVLDESLLAILKVYYKSEKRHPDTINITKSIFDGIEKSGLIINDAQIRKIMVEEYYDKQNPRFELELFGESEFSISYSIEKIAPIEEKRLYTSIKKSLIPKNIEEFPTRNSLNSNCCSICKKTLALDDFISGDKGKTLICRPCFKKLF